MGLTIARLAHVGRLTAPARMFTTAALLGALSLCGTPAMAQSTPRQMVDEWLAQIGIAGLKVTTASIDPGPNANDLIVRDLRISAPQGQADAGIFHVPAITFTGLTRSSDGATEAKSILAPNAEFTGKLPDGGTLTAKIGNIEERDVRLISFVGLTIDPDHPVNYLMEVLRRSRDARIGSAAISDVTIDATGKDGPFHLSYDGLTIRNSANLHVDEIVSGKMSITGKSPEGPVEVTIGQIVMRNYDFNPYLALIDPQAYVDGKGSDDWKTYLESMDFNGFDISAPQAHVALAHFGLRDIKLRQMQNSPGDFFDRVVNDKAKQPSSAEAARLLPQLLRTFSYGELSFDGLQVNGTGLEQALLGRILLKGFSGEGIERFEVDGIDIKSREGAFKLSRAGFAGLVFPSIEILTAATEAATRNQPPPDPLALAPTVASVFVESLFAQQPAKGWVKLDTLSFEFSDYIKAIPTKVQAVLQGLNFPTSLIDDAEARNAMLSMGYRQANISARLATSWNEQDQAIDLSDTSVTLEDGGTLTISHRLGNVPRDLFEHPEQASTLVTGITLVKAALAYRDASLVDRIIKAAATKLGKSQDAIRQQASGAVEAGLNGIGDATFKRTVVDAVKAFLKAPKSFAISTEPATPLSIAEIIGTFTTAPQTLPQRLNVKVIANQ